MISIALQKELDGAGGTIYLDVDFQVQSGTIVALMGPSGAGKTSILRMLSGIQKPAGGKIEVDGTVWYDGQKSISMRPQKRNVGLVFQDLALFPHMSVIDQIRYAISSEQEHKVDELLSMMDLTKLKSKKPKQLSGGQQQRVALARSIIQSPKLLLLDEPLSALDYEMKVSMRDYIKKVHERYGMTIILVSHDRQDVLDLCEQAYYLVEGKITRQGKPGKLSMINRLTALGKVVDKRKKDDVWLVTIEQDGHQSIIRITDASDISVGDHINFTTRRD